MWMDLDNPTSQVESFVQSIKGFPLFATTNAKASTDMQKKERKQTGGKSIAAAWSNDSSEPR